MSKPAAPWWQPIPQHERGLFFRAARELAGYKAAAVADVAGYSESYILLLETGRRAMSDRLARIYTEALRRLRGSRA